VNLQPLARPRDLRTTSETAVVAPMNFPTAIGLIVVGLPSAQPQQLSRA
jgi:hypothetical protein